MSVAQYWIRVVGYIILPRNKLKLQIWHLEINHKRKGFEQIRNNFNIPFHYTVEIVSIFFCELEHWENSVISFMKQQDHGSIS